MTFEGAEDIQLENNTSFACLENTCSVQLYGFQSNAARAGFHIQPRRGAALRNQNERLELLAI